MAGPPPPRAEVLIATRPLFLTKNSRALEKSLPNPRKPGRSLTRPKTAPFWWNFPLGLGKRHLCHNDVAFYASSLAPALLNRRNSDAPDPQEESAFKAEATSNEDLEDGEIEDDDEEAPCESAAPEQPAPESPPSQAPPPLAPNAKNNRAKFERPHNNRYEERKRGHLTEAERSVMRLHKQERKERMEREKRDRYKREQATVVDDFACNLEKALADVLKKDKKPGSDNEKDEEDKRGKKRKKKDKDKKKAKQRRVGSPKPEEYDENEMMNVRRGSPDGSKRASKERSRSPSLQSDYDSYESSASSDRSHEDRKDVTRKKGARPKNRVRGDRKFKDRARDQKAEAMMMKEAQGAGICMFYLQGKCNKGDDCPFVHEIPMQLKLELCKFYLMDCCAKGDKCLYMHSEFPCKFYHMGLRCQAGESCKFAHGKPLHEGLKQILFKHIETAPKEILGEFPRLSRDGALNMINQAQKALETKYGDKKEAAAAELTARGIIPSLFELNIPVPTELLSKDDSKSKEKGDKPTGRERSRPSRWQEADPEQQKQQLQQMTFGLKGFYSDRGDQDMRVTSNGDIDMRTLPPQLVASPSHGSPKLNMDQYLRDASPKQDIDIRVRPQDTDIRQLSVDLAKDVDIRRVPPQFDVQVDNDDNDNTVDEPNLEIVMEDETAEPLPGGGNAESSKSDTDVRVGFESKDTDIRPGTDFPANLPKKQRELFLRIQAQQKENLPENQKDLSDDDKNIDWYSDDDDDCRLTIKDDVEEPKPVKVDEVAEVASPPIPPLTIKPVEVIEKLGDLSKIDISAEVTKLLSSISQAGGLKELRVEPPRDPRLAGASQAVDVPKPSVVPVDPRRARVSSTETKKTEKLSIYEQGSISIENAAKDVDLRNIERDLDLRPIFSGDIDLRPTPGRPDIDLRQLGLPFKAIQNYTPASEIDATCNSLSPLVWKLHLVDVPRPDYTGLKLSAHEAQNTGDPRLRKIFRLSIDEKDSPASPKESPKATPPPPVAPVIRTDPRRRREEKPEMNYTQQLNLLQESPFYQTLTSSQKVLLNQELSSTKLEQGGAVGSNDPTLNGILTNLGLIPGPSANSSALNILASVNNLNPMMMGGQGLMGPSQNFGGQPVNPNILSQNPNIVNQMAQSMVQPGLLGPAPGVANLPPDFQLNFDPRQGGLLGNAPVINNYNDNSNFNDYNEDYYEGNQFEDEGPPPPPPPRGRGRGRPRGGFRDRQPRRGRNFSNNRNSGGRNFRSRNRSHRSRSPP